MIRAQGLTRTFRRGKEVVHAVQGLDLDVAEGELVAFLGPNGAGKSTTLRMLTSLLRPTAGTATVAGHDIVDDPAAVRSRIGFIGQGNGGGHSYRLLDELHNQGRFYGLPAAEYRPRAAELAAALDLTGMEKRTISSLSGGQRRRLDVALGLMNHPPLLFLDEPSTGLDPHARANLWEHITGMRQRYGMTLCLTTHYLEEADSMAERVIVIDHGRIIADAPPAELKRDHAEDVIRFEVAATASPVDLDGLVTRAWPDDLAAPTVGAPNRDGAVPVTVSTAFGPSRLPELLHRLDEAGVAVRSAEVTRASLDDVFLNLTGRSLREDAA